MKKSILSPVASQSTRRCLLAAVLTLSLPLVSQAALIFDVGDYPDVSAANPTITLSLHNDGGSQLVIRGADVFFTIQAGGPTVSTSGNPSLSLNLLTGTVFGNGFYGQSAYTPIDSQSQGWGLYNFNTNPATWATVDPNQTVTLGTLTFNSFPTIGTFGLDFLGTKFYDQTGINQITPFTLINGSLTVVPEPVHVALPIFGSGAVLIGGVRRWYRRPARVG